MPLILVQLNPTIRKSNYNIWGRSLGHPLGMRRGEARGKTRTHHQHNCIAEEPHKRGTYSSLMEQFAVSIGPIIPTPIIGHEAYPRKEGKFIMLSKRVSILAT